MPQLSKSRRVNVAALIVAAAGLLILFASRPELFPRVPPGPIMLVVAAALVAFVPGRFTPAIGVIVALFILVGGFLAGAIPDLLINPGNAGAFVGFLIQLAGLITAIVGGVVALRSGG